MDKDATYYYALKQCVVPRGHVALRALMICQLCNATISPHGGPSFGCLCLRCGTALNAGDLRGTVIWDKPTPVDKG